MNEKLKEIREAREVAVEVLNLLNQAEGQLKSARNWGIYDILGGEFLSSVIKHRKIKKADTLLTQVRLKVGKLRKELSDVQLNLHSQLPVSGFDRFLDIWVDNIFSDWMVQSKIKENLGQVTRAKQDIERVILTLDQLKAEYESLHQ